MNDFLVDLNGLRKRIKEAIAKGVLEDNAGGVFETAFTQLVNEAEQNRLNYQNKADQFERQAAVFRGHASAFNSFKSMAYGIVDGLVIAKEKEEEDLREEEDARDDEDIDMEAAEEFERLRQEAQED